MMEEIKQVVDSYNEYIVKVPAGCIIIANDLRVANKNRGLAIIQDFIDGMFWLIEADKLLIQNKVATGFSVEKATEFLNEINSGLENNDYFLVADLFEYEVAPFFEKLDAINFQNN